MGSSDEVCCSKGPLEGTTKMSGRLHLRCMAERSFLVQHGPQQRYDSSCRALQIQCTFPVTASTFNIPLILQRTLLIFLPTQWPKDGHRQSTTGIFILISGHVSKRFSHCQHAQHSEIDDDDNHPKNPGTGTKQPPRKLGSGTETLINNELPVAAKDSPLPQGLTRWR